MNRKTKAIARHPLAEREIMTINEFEKLKNEGKNIVLVQRGIRGIYGTRVFVFSGTPDVITFLSRFDIWQCDGRTSRSNEQTFEFDGKESWEIMHTDFFRRALGNMGATLLFDGEDIVPC